MGDLGSALTPADVGSGRSVAAREREETTKALHHRRVESGYRILLTKEKTHLVSTRTDLVQV